MTRETPKNKQLLPSPNSGKFHRNEWTFLGSPSEVMEEFCLQLATHFVDYKLGFLGPLKRRKAIEGNFQISLREKGDEQYVSSQSNTNVIQARNYFNELDFLFINGNSQIGGRQIVLNDPDFLETFSTQADALDDLRMILLKRSADDIPSFVMDKIEDKEVLIFRQDQTDKIVKAMLTDYVKSLPPLYGLVLAGGKSQRMGTDKGAIEYHGKAQREYQADLLKTKTYRTFISCRKNQDELIETEYEKLYDSFDKLGPYGGILSAFRAYPDSAWLTVACDLPFLDGTQIETLVKSRDRSKLATCFLDPSSGLPEPLLTIWEPRAYPVLLEYLGHGFSSAKKVLKEGNVKVVEIEDTSFLKSANCPEDSKEARRILSQKGLMTP